MTGKSIKDFIQKNTGSLAVPISMIIIGLLFICLQGDAINFTVKIIGIVFVVAGIIMASSLLASFSPFVTVISAVLVIFGILVIALSRVFVNFIVVVLGIIILVNSAIRIYDAYKVKGRSDNFIKYIINDILTLILGLILILLPGNIANAAVITIGVVLIILGITNIITAIKVYKDGRYVDDGTDVVWEE